MEEMIRVSKNEACDVSYLRKKYIMYEVFDVGMLSSKKHLVLTASPYAIPLLHYTNFKE